MQRCRFCQAELDPASAICPQCGRTQPDQFAEGPTLFAGQTVGGPESSPDDTLTLPSDRISKSLAGDPEDTFDLMLPGRMTSGQVNKGQTPAQVTETPQETGAPCPACGTARRPGARFCPNCGMAF